MMEAALHSCCPSPSAAPGTPWDGGSRSSPWLAVQSGPHFQKWHQHPNKGAWTGLGLVVNVSDLQKFHLHFFKLEEAPLHFPLMPSSSKSPRRFLVLPQGSLSAGKAPTSSLHSQVSIDDLFWSHRSDCLTNVAGKRDTYFEFKEKKKIKIEEEKKLIGIGMKDQDWTQTRTRCRL